MIPENIIYFIPLGGAGEIGSSCFYLNIDGTGILLDCGMHPRKNGMEALPDFSLIENEEVDYVFISHAHTDHIAALPFLVRLKPWVKIFSTPQTRAIAEVTLHNSVSIIQEQLGKDNPVKPYTHSEVDLLIQSIHYRSYGDKVRLKGYRHYSSGSLEVTFLDAGHILGSAGILIEYEGKRIFYTGDINLKDQSWMKGARLNGLKADVLILENTYGATPSELVPGWAAESARLAYESNNILSEGGSVLIPVFSLGKMQEMLSTLWKLMIKNRLIKTDIFTGGIAKKITRIYDYSRYNVSVTEPSFQFSDIPVRDIYQIERPDYFRHHPSILLLPSGMMIQRTLSYRYALEFLHDKKSAIFTTGYMDPDTPGYVISNSAKNEKIRLPGGRSDIKVKCEIRKFRFTAHSVREDLIRIAASVNPERIVLVHGDEGAIDWTGLNILTRFPHIKVHSAQAGRRIDF